MQRRVNPREAKRMMQRMGMSMDGVEDVTEVVIRTSSKDIVIRRLNWRSAPANALFHYHLKQAVF